MKNATKKATKTALLVGTSAFSGYIFGIWSLGEAQIRKEAEASENS